MCQKCKKDSCGGCGDNSLASEMNSLSNQVAELMDKLTDIEKDTKFLKDGHPILLIEHADDVAQFDLTTGKGDSDWLGWAICDGQTHLNVKTKKNIITPNFTDRFIVQAGGTYALDDTGGTATETLTTAQIPAHNHPVTDPGHTHSIVDPGHDHPVTDPGHIHGGTGVAHTHTFTTSADGNHTHLVPEPIDSINDAGSGGQFAMTDPVSYGNSGIAGAHNHTGTTDSATAGVTVASAFTGVDVTDSFTGITAGNSVTGISTDDTGGAGSHNNLPPFYAAFYVIKVY